MSSQLAFLSESRTASSTRVTSALVSSGPVSFRLTVRPWRSVMVRLVRMAILNRHSGNRKPVFRQMLFHALAGIAAGDEDRVGLAAEGMNHARRVDAAPAGRLAHRVDVGAIFESQAVDTENPVDGGIDGEGDDQSIILSFHRQDCVQGGAGFFAGDLGEAGGAQKLLKFAQAAPPASTITSIPSACMLAASGPTPSSFSNFRRPAARRLRAGGQPSCGVNGDVDRRSTRAGCGPRRKGQPRADRR